MDHRPLSVNVSYGFIILNIIVWFALGIIIAFNLHPALPDEPLVTVIMSVLSFAAAGSLLVTFILLQKHSRVAYFLMLAFLGIASILIIFDDVGWVDLAALALSLIPLILVIKDRGWHLKRQAQ
jgi:hypothetical protein